MKATDGMSTIVLSIGALSQTLGCTKLAKNWPSIQTKAKSQCFPALLNCYATQGGHNYQFAMCLELMAFQNGSGLVLQNFPVLLRSDAG